jgi:transposase
MTYSMDLRKRVVVALNRGESVAAAARKFEVARSTAGDWHKRAVAGQLEPDRPGPTCPRKLTPADDRILREHVAARPGITAKELMRLIGGKVVESTVDRRLIALGLRLKKSR